MHVQHLTMSQTALIIALLRETKQTPLCTAKTLALTSKTCQSAIEESLRRLQETCPMTIVDDCIHLTPEQRLRVAEIALTNGADPEQVARELSWQEFERFIRRVLDLEGYAATTHFIFKHSGRRFEIDVLGSKEPVVICVDCKHWHHGSAASKIKLAAKNQLQRAESLSHVFMSYGKKHGIARWRSTRLLPIVLTLADLSPTIIEGVPVVSALRLRDFLCQYSPWNEELRFVDVPLSLQALLTS